MNYPNKSKNKKKHRNSVLNNIEIHTLYQEKIMCEEVFLVKYQKT